LRRTDGDVVIPVAGPAGSSAGHRIATSETHLSGLVLDRQRSGNGSRFWRLLVHRCGAGSFARFATGTEFIEAQGAGTEMSALVEPTLVANDFPRIEGGTTPRRRLCGMAIETAATEVLGFLARGVVGELYGKGGTSRRKVRGMVRL
jgi:hypothetical protein